LFDDDQQIGVLYLRVETWWTHASGHLWWRRWSGPWEAVHSYIAYANGRFDDFVEDLDTVADELHDWGRGRFLLRGECLEVEWLDDAASRQARTDVFGLDGTPEIGPHDSGA
jgi:hypothetical protein